MIKNGRPYSNENGSIDDGLITSHPDNEINIVLNHIPEISIQDFCQTNYDIMLCGHTHGGQIFPIHILSYIFNACFMGLYSMNNKHIYVSTGTSTATIPMRILSDSMIEVININ